MKLGLHFRPSRCLRSSALLALAGTSLLLLHLGCGSRHPPPGVLLISIDTIRADHMSVYGYARPSTPNLEAFAADAVVFDNAYAASSTTGPSHATLFTGIYAPRHGVNANAVVLAERHHTLAEVLRDEGYQTAAVIGSFVLDARFGFAQGYDVYQQDFGRDEGKFDIQEWEGIAIRDGFDRRATVVSRRAVEWLTRTRKPHRPFLLTLHYFDPHEPYRPPIEYARRLAAGRNNLRAGYDGEIAYVDDEIGRVLAALDKLGLAKTTLVVITGDHGQGLTQHNDPYHAVNIYEESVRVPLMMRWPGRLRPGRRSLPVEQVDVLPTILGALDIGAPEEIDGLDLGVGWRSNEDRDLASRPIFLYRQFYSPGRKLRKVVLSGEQFAVRVEDWKLIIAEDERRRELYDLGRDPGELENLYDARPAVVTRLTPVLDAWRRYVTTPPGQRILGEEERAKLRALGYVE
jgi:arylsulfatase A-like enzyme